MLPPHLPVSQLSWRHYRFGKCCLTRNHPSGHWHLSCETCHKCTTLKVTVKEPNNEMDVGECVES